jgi:signal transduction histidine kinase
VLRALIPLLLAAIAGGPAAPLPGGSAVALPVLTDIKAIRALSQSEAARGYPVRIRGVVTHFDELNSEGLFLFDGTSGQFVEAAKGGSLVAWGPMRSGDTIEIVGHTIRGGFAPNVVPEDIRNFGALVKPVPLHLPQASLLTGRHDCEYVEVSGVIRRAWVSTGSDHTMFADLIFEGGMLRVIFWDHHTGDLERFVDAKVRVRGNVGTIFSPTEQLVGVSLHGGRTSDVQILEPAPDPMTLPLQEIGNIFTYSYSAEVNRRIRIRGVVVGDVPAHEVAVSDFTSKSVFRSVRHVIYVKDATGSASLESEQTSTLQPGDVIEAAGFPSVSPGKPVLGDTVFKVIGKGPVPAPIVVPAGSVVRADNDAELARVDAQLLGIVKTPSERVFVLKSSAGDTAFEAALDAAQETAALDEIRPGSAVRMTGVYSYQAGPPAAFRLILRTPADIVVTAQAPWWTPRHTAVLVVMLLLALGAAIVGVKTMTARERREYQAVLSERNRVARELHDTLEQGLTGISLQLEAVAGTVQSSPHAARQSLEVARQMLRYSLEETRRSVMDLRSQALESNDLPAALSTLARQMTLGTPIVADVRIDGQRRRLDAAQEHHLLRIGLEAVTNAVKHSGASRVDILVRFTPSALRLVVADNGCGVQRESGDIDGGHFGLQGIRERANKIGAELELDSRPGVGTRLSVTAPIVTRAAATPITARDPETVA